jgi:hypothetical protein
LLLSIINQQPIPPVRASPERGRTRPIYYDHIVIITGASGVVVPQLHGRRGGRCLDLARERLGVLELQVAPPPAAASCLSLSDQPSAEPKPASLHMHIHFSVGALIATCQPTRRQRTCE